MDRYKDFFSFSFTKKDMYSKNLIQFTIVVGYTFIFLKIPLSVMYTSVFKFQNMVNMH
jgi:hypothetical protein